MPGIVANTAFTLNGISNFSIGGVVHTWVQPSKYVGWVETYDITVGTPHTVTVSLSGSGWFVGTLRFFGNLRPVITDATAAAAEITTIQAFGSHGSTMTFNRANVGAIFGGDGIDIITTNNLATGWTDFISTGRGNDRVTTRAGYVGDVNTFDGNDTVTTGTGWVSAIRMGAGYDVVTIGRGSDLVDLADGGGRVTTGTQWVGYINSYGNYQDIITTKTGDVGFINIGEGNDSVTTGTGWVETVNLGAGNDTIILGSSNIRTIIGGAGNDTYNLQSFAPQLISDSAGIDTAATSVSRSLASWGNIENLILNGTAAINGTGNAAANTMTGNTGANSLDGGAGNDIIIGGVGNDRIIGGAGIDTLYGGTVAGGGAGIDTFVFNVAPSAANRDIIQDCNAVDIFQLENAVMPGLGVTTGLLLPAAFRAGAAALDASDRIIYNAATGALYYDSNGNAASGAVQLATLSQSPGVHPVLTAADFQVI